jgi:hypothetical protein
MKQEFYIVSNVGSEIIYLNTIACRVDVWTFDESKKKVFDSISDVLETIKLVSDNNSSNGVIRLISNFHE